MALIHAYDHSTDLTFSEGYLPDMETILSAAPKLPKHLRPTNIKFSSREHALAWVLTACTRRVTYYRRFELPKPDLVSTELQLETWVLGPPRDKEAMFAAWFAAEPPEPEYRVMVHYTPRTYMGQETLSLWASMYRYNYVRKVLRLRHRQVNSELRRATKLLLDNILAAYEGGRDNVESLMRETGHPYWYSSGLPIS